jgi:hypothetical protein
MSITNGFLKLRKVNLWRPVVKDKGCTGKNNVIEKQNMLK